MSNPDKRDAAIGVESLDDRLSGGRRAELQGSVQVSDLCGRCVLFQEEPPWSGPFVSLLFPPEHVSSELLAGILLAVCGRDLYLQQTEETSALFAFHSMAFVRMDGMSTAQNAHEFGRT